MPQAEQATALAPLIHGVDAAFRAGFLSVEKTCGLMEHIRGAAWDVHAIEKNARNILFGWTMRREERRPQAPAA